MGLVPKDHPLMIAWTAYQATDEYANAQKWAMTTYEGQHPYLEGSLWAMFVAGYKAAGGNVTI